MLNKNSMHTIPLPPSRKLKTEQTAADKSKQAYYVQCVTFSKSEQTNT